MNQHIKFTCILWSVVLSPQPVIIQSLMEVHHALPDSDIIPKIVDTCTCWDFNPATYCTMLMGPTILYTVESVIWMGLQFRVIRYNAMYTHIKTMCRTNLHRSVANNLANLALAITYACRK